MLTNVLPAIRSAYYSNVALTLTPITCTIVSQRHLLIRPCMVRYWGGLRFTVCSSRPHYPVPVTQTLNTLPGIMSTWPSAEIIKFLS